ncbi:MAG: hypothetical protein PWQ67_2152 [Clostridia bacterium]|jgi:hypothetical protein|nr:hypothetical protein [Clostridia bacterium]
MNKLNGKKAISTAGKLMGKTSPAAAVPGEMTFTQTVPGMGGMMSGMELGPLKYLLGGIGRISRGMTGVFKDKKRLIPVLILAILWVIPLLLSALGVKTSTLNLVNFVTFAQGGTGGGILGMAGGLIGKGFFAYFIFVMILPFFTGGKPFAGLRRGLKGIFQAFTSKDKSTRVSLLWGAGFALMGYNFLTGNASMENSMVGIAAFLMAAKSLVNRGGFLRGFIMSLHYKFYKGQVPNTSHVTSIMTGWAAGFALGVPLSATGISIIGYLSGIVLILAGVVMKNVKGSKKEMMSG